MALESVMSNSGDWRQVEHAVTGKHRLDLLKAIEGERARVRTLALRTDVYC